MAETRNRRIGTFAAGDGRRLPVTELYADEHILVIDKPPGLLSIPDRYDAEQAHVTGVLRQPDLMIVHRLDRNTSGVLILARNAEAHASLNRQFAERGVAKEYLALVHGKSAEDEFEVTAPLTPAGGPGHRTVVRPGGKEARTRVVVVEAFARHSLVAAFPLTGRQHQVRVHLAHAGLPIVADELYGDGLPLLLSNVKHRYREGRRPERPLLDRLALHARAVTFHHPDTGAAMTVEAPLPKDMAATVSQLRKWG